MSKDLPAGWHEKPGRMILAQIDHLSGESLAALAEELRQAGMSGVQLCPSITKKNRPGQIGLIDPGGEAGLKRAALILASFGISGFHLIETSHVHLPAVTARAKVTVRSGKEKVEAEVGINRLALPGQAEVVRVEFDDLIMLSAQIKTGLGQTLTPPELDRRLGAALATCDKANIDMD